MAKAVFFFNSFDPLGSFWNYWICWF